jgi:Zn-dependent alcohol dehydrogenase
MVMKNQSMITVGSYDAASLRGAVDFLDRNVGRLPLDHVLVDYPLEGINEAFADQDAGKVTRASIVMTSASGS